MGEQDSRSRSRARIAMMIAATLVVGACSSSSKSSSTTTSGAKNFQVTLPQGQVSLSLTGALPPGWPPEFPVAPEAKVAGSGSLGGENATTMVGVYTTTQTPDQAYAFYAQSSKLNVSNQHVVNVGSRYIGTMRLTGTFAGSLGVFGRADGTYIVVALNSAGTATSSSTAAPAVPPTS